MSRGFPEYGARISPCKTLASFELDGATEVATLNEGGRCLFPYCGFRLDTASLDFSIDIERLLGGELLTISPRADVRHAAELCFAQFPAARRRLRRMALAPAREPQPRCIRELATMGSS